MAAEPRTIYLRLIPLEGMGFFSTIPWEQRDASKDTDLITAVLSGEVEEVEKCLKAHQEKKDLTEALSACDASGKTAFALACSEGAKIEILKALFPHLTPTIAKIKDNSQNSAFDYAMKNNDFEGVCYELMRHGLVSPFDKDKEGNNALMLALLKRRKKITQVLITGADERSRPLLLDRNTEGDDALYLALSMGEYEIAATLLEKGSDIEGPDETGKTRLMLAVKHLPDTAVQFLIRHRANINAVNKEGDTIFIQMLREENVNMVRYLMEQGADITLRDKSGKSALDIVRSMPDSPETRSMIQLLTSPFPRVPLPVDYRKMCLDALNKGDKETLEYASAVLGEDFLTTPLNQGLRPLHIAARLGHRAIVEYLIEQEVDLFPEDENGNTPLMFAAAGGHLDIVKLLHKRGSDLDHENKAKETALVFATKCNQKDIIRYIQEIDARYKLEIPQSGLTRTSFVVDNNSALAPELPVQKGLALILEYFQQKDRANRKKGSRAYIADSLKAFQYGLSLLNKAKDGTEYGLIYAVAGHNLAVKCEKINGENHIILMDSLGSEGTHFGAMEYGGDNHAEVVENIVAEVFTTMYPRTFFYKNRESRQTSGEVCTIYTEKDLRKMLGIEQLSTALSRNKYIKETTKNKSITVHSFLTPAEFMRLGQSHDSLAAYAKENKEQAERLLRRNKSGQVQKFMDYALTEREKFGVKTPERIENRNFGPEQPHEPQYIYKNHSIFYFARKYIAVIDRMLNGNTGDQLTTIIDSHNAANLKIGPDGSVMSREEERVLLENQELHRLRMIEKRRREEEREFAEMKMSYEASQQQLQQQQHVNFRDSGIILENDTITAEELNEYIFSVDNPWNSTFMAPSFLFSRHSLVQFKFDRVAYLKETAQELRDKKAGERAFYTPSFQSVAAQSARGGLAHYQVGSESRTNQVVGEAHGPENTQSFVEAQPSAKKRKVVLGT